MPSFAEIIGYINIIGLLILGFLQLRQTSKTQATDARVKLANEKEIEDRITEAVLHRAEAQLKAYKEENDTLRNENTKLRNEHADAMRMMRAIRMITIKLVKRMEAAGIDPELTQEERDALYDTGKLTEFAKRQQ